MRTSIGKRESLACVRFAPTSPRHRRAFSQWWGRQTLAVLITVVMVTSSFLVRVQAADGDLDITFELDGKLTTDFFGQSDLGNDIAVQSNGKIIVAGRVAKGVDSDFGLARYEGNGALDAGFGIGGKVTTDFFGSFDACLAVVVQGDGKIVAAGSAFADGGDNSNNVGLARYDIDGSLDAGFGDNGKVSSDFGGGINDEAIDVAVQGDGKIVVLVGEGAGANSDFILARYNSDGTPDGGFGGGFPVTTDFFGGDDGPAALALQSDGRIIAVGGAAGGIGGSDFALSRYNSDGSPDATFGVGGKLTTDFLGEDVAISVVVQGDGKIIAAGRTNVAGGGRSFALARYTSQGVPDALFGVGGKVITDFSDVIAGVGEVAVECDGQIVVAGTVGLLGSRDAGLVRFNSDGNVDAGFGNGGIIITDFLGGDDSAHGVAVQSDGKIVAAGSARNGSSADGIEFALARYADAACVAAPPCPNPQGYWKNIAAVWPVGSLTLGSQSYTQSELLAILNTPSNGDASLILAKQLITAKLNVANGSEAAPAANSIAAGDSLFAGLNGKLPYKVKSSSAKGQAMTSIAGVLETYNGALLTPGCAP